jgi:hypothetical protein
MKLVRTFLIALGLSLLFGLTVGTLLRLRLERPTYYLGARLRLAPLPLDVGDSRACILDPRQHEEQVG